MSAILSNTAFMRRIFSSIVIASGLAMLASCGGGGSDSDDAGSGETLKVSAQSLRTGQLTGITQGVTSPVNAFTGVLSSSSAMESVTDTVLALAGLDSGDDDSDEAGLIEGTVTETLELFSSLIEDSDISETGSTYTLDPNEAEICAQIEDATPEEIADCETLLSHITMVVTVNQVVNDEVTAATTDFNYDTSTFAVVDYTQNSGYYETILSGLRVLLAAIVDLDEEIDMEMPDVMQGTIRAAFTAPGENAGSVTLSVPQALRIEDNTAGEEINFTLATTNKLFELVADGDANTMSMEVAMGALDILASDSDEFDNSFPIQLLMDALTGKLELADNGNALQLTGVGIDTVRFRVDSRQALALNLEQLSAMLNVSDSNNAVTFSNALDFNLNIENVRGYFEDLFDSTSEAETLTATATASAGTTVTEVAEDLLQVSGGTLSVSVVESSGTTLLNAPDGSCIDSMEVVACP